MATHPPMITNEVEFLPSASIMLSSVLDFTGGFLAFLAPGYVTGWMGYDGTNYDVDHASVRIIATMLMTRAMIYFYGGRCISNTTAQGSVFQRTILGVVVMLLALVGSVPMGLFGWFGVPNLLGAAYTYMAVKRFQIEERGEDEFSLIDEMRWAFMTPGEE